MNAKISKTKKYSNNLHVFLKVFSFDCPDAFKYLYSPNLSSARLQNMEQIAEQVATLCVTLEEYPAIRYRK